MEIVEKLHNSFLEEAKRSPILLSDLANMEKYISESYTGRSLIELLQNADDAGASKFEIVEISSKVYGVANNGREFCENDLVSLCRSGTSTKKRKTNTIGYRGIGFKSVVNYAKAVHLYSGHIATTFSRQLTKNLLPEANTVPLIRIPHKFCGNAYDNSINDLLRDRYSTVFVFETESDCLLDEISMFDTSCMLFLRNIREIHFTLSTKKITYMVKYTNLNSLCDEIEFLGTQNNDRWIVCSDELKSDVKLAFKYDGNRVIPASPQESVIHSFMPTNDKLNVPIKINGDFSTDPSRTKVIYDTETENAIEGCVDLTNNILKNILAENYDRYGFINILAQASLDPLRAIKGNTISDIYIEKLIKKSKEQLKKYAEDVKEIYYQPQGITNVDFEQICRINNVYGIGNDIDANIRGILQFVKMIGIRILPLEMMLDAMKDCILSKESRIEVMYELIDRSRFGLDKALLTKFNNANVITFNTDVKKVINCDKNDIIEDSFNAAVIEKVGSVVYVEQFYKVLGLKNIRQQGYNKEISPSVISRNVGSIGTKSVVKKWRTVEQNLGEILRSLDGVVNVIDVAAQNVGYDIETIMTDGTHRYYEVKSVDNMGNAFTMTNNEFSAAVQYKDKYYLAIVQQDESRIEVCFICDPISTLNMTKRVTKWEWYCSSYTGEFLECNIG
jgi:hypothetical protein